MNQCQRLASEHHLLDIAGRNRVLYPELVVGCEMMVNERARRMEFQCAALRKMPVRSQLLMQEARVVCVAKGLQETALALEDGRRPAQAQPRQARGTDATGGADPGVRALHFAAAL
ncbi:hypothetical protein D9M68_972560 [compost metagenome]